MRGRRKVNRDKDADDDGRVEVLRVSGIQA
jgi:hypothetical protein